ncbi:hypothetical protein AGOR_G00119760 [Albula goreensis]|uniref:Ig-like domain-containing protein n=1 Tax=Albula goreensis TaxID=1534307 RepID=A0A8T3DHB5_9TELE|nr:hypothetical protein AGOR_G00119760 [Albula goreensis]
MNFKSLVCQFLALWMSECLCISVRFPSEKPLHAALARTLVVEAQIEEQPGEEVVDVTWERESEGSQGKVRLYPVDPQDPRLSVERDGATLRVTNLRQEDYGVYIFTVTNQEGYQAFAKRTVRKSEVPPKATIPLLCDVTHGYEQWDTPVIVWLVDGVKVSNQTTANLSADGRMLYPSGECVRNYTCIVNSSLGYSTAHFYTGCYTKPDDQPRSHVCTWLWVSVIIVLAVGFIVWKCIKKRRRNGSRQH